MRCLSCEKFSFKLLCKKCQNSHLLPNFLKKELQNDFFVYSFYNYEEIEPLILSKYHFYGDRVYKILAQLSFKKFAQSFEYPQKVYAIAIDDHTRHDFSQTAILTKHLKCEKITPLYNVLKASNIVKYAGKDLEFRQKNPRKFIYEGKKNVTCFLVDDLVTTGTTILEAKKVLKKHNVEVLFALTLASFV